MPNFKNGKVKYATEVHRTLRGASNISWTLWIPFALSLSKIWLITSHYTIHNNLKKMTNCCLATALILCMHHCLRRCAS